jgi:curved DNA-binding protein CbpA
MNGQISEHPLAELIHEISAKSLSGRLQVQHDRTRVVVYFEDGALLYAASNALNLRLREYLLKADIAADALTRYDQRRPDLELVKALCADQVLPVSRAEQIQTRQVTDIVRLALSWVEGTWDFDPRARLDNPPQLELDTNSLLLAFPGLLQRENSKSVLGDRPAVRGGAPVKTEPAPVRPVEDKRDEIADAQTFLEQLGKAQTHYDVLDVSRESTAEQMKLKYYELARRYHPDRFRRAEATLVRRLESAFARVTQAYDTLCDDRLRANYDSKLLARRKAQQLAESAPKPTRPVPEKPAPTTQTTREAKVSIAERAEQQFKEGYAAFESGQKKIALGLFASAANAVPKEARYRAFYGRVLAEHEDTRRAAEAELQAAVKLDPKNGEYRVMLAELYRDLGFMLRARGEAERAIAADPNNRQARELLRTLKSV